MADKQAAPGVGGLTKRLRRKGSDVSKDKRSTSHERGPNSIPALMIHDSEVPPPVDFENFLDVHHGILSRDPFKDLLVFPENDIKVCTEQRFCRTQESTIPEAAAKSTVPHINRCTNYLNSNFSICERMNIVASGTRLSNLRQRQSEKEKTNMFPHQEYELDTQNDPKPEESQPPPSRFSRTPSVKRSSVSDNTMRQSNALDVASQSGRSSLMPNSFDMHQSSSTGLAELVDTEEDDVLQDVLDENLEDVELDRLNKERRDEKRTSRVMELYPYMEFDDARIEDRQAAMRPAEQIGYRIMVKCLDLSLELEVEPIYAVMALYDIREKKKISE
ncbi:dedicator of cytokinesis protein 7-like, partial [Sycon ciliatum]|uniref:dedicator of cytokinesis protein 7-like n=1 Tax=Sycon ciliatum TaxID=27933 RepID=UPI0020AA05E1|eukprot:scpid92199/ scgid15071/ Dedicator of cytokinesis protein 7